MTIQEAVAEIIRVQTKDIFKNPERFFACLRDYAPEYPKEVRFIRNNFDDKLLGLFIDETKKVSHRVRLIKDQLEDFCYSDEKIYFYLESFGIPLGWEQEILDFKADSPIQVSSFNQQTQKQNQITANVTDISLSVDILKQWGFQDKNSIPDVLNIPSTYKSPFGTMYRIIKIDSEVFKDCTSLKLVNIPDTVTEIGNRAFANCSLLENINIPNSVTKIGVRAFFNCKSLNSINIPSEVTDIEDGAFAGCESLVTVTIPNKITKIPEGLFAKCKSLVNVTIPDGVMEIGNFAFADCKSMSSFIVPKTVTKIGKMAFANCNSLDIFVVPNSVTNIETEAFIGCDKLQQFTGPTKYTIFKDDVNKQIDLKLTEDNIEAYIEVSLDREVLKQLGYEKKDSKVLDKNEKNITSLVIPETYTSNGSKYKIIKIEYNLFSNCTYLISVTIPNSITEIGECAFEGCTYLKEINIPKNIKEIKLNAFRGCNSLKPLNYSKEFDVAIDKQVLKQLGYEIKDNKIIDKNGKNIKSFDIPSIYIYNSNKYKITEITADTFTDCTYLTSVTIPNSVIKIGSTGLGALIWSTFNLIKGSGIGPFSNCTSLRSITIPESVTIIGFGAFAGCSSLENVTIPNSVIEIGNMAFKDCDSLTFVNIPNSVAEIGDMAFWGVEHIEYHGTASGAPWGARSMN